MKELTGKDDSKMWVSDEGGVWLDSGDVNRLLLHHGRPGLESMGGKPIVDEIGDHCPKDDVDFIVIEGGNKADPIAYGYCEVCGHMYLDLALDPDASVEAIEAAILDYFREFYRPPAGTRAARA